MTSYGICRLITVFDMCLFIASAAYCSLCRGKISHTKTLMCVICLKLLHGRHTVAVAETLIIILRGWLVNYCAKMCELFINVSAVIQKLSRIRRTYSKNMQTTKTYFFLNVNGKMSQLIKM